MHMNISKNGNTKNKWIEKNYAINVNFEILRRQRSVFYSTVLYGTVRYSAGTYKDIRPNGGGKKGLMLGSSRPVPTGRDSISVLGTMLKETAIRPLCGCGWVGGGGEGECVCMCVCVLRRGEKIQRREEKGRKGGVQ